MGDRGDKLQVTLTKPFYMGKYEVTQEQWESVMGKNPSKVKEAKLPVTRASWDDCQEFIKKLNANTNGGYRLPTEAEWEYACRAGTTTAYSFGDAITPKDANYRDSKIGEPVAVGSYKPNAFGIYDMHGNVWESVSTEEGSAHVICGGGWHVLGEVCRASNRIGFVPDRRFTFLGFRLLAVSIEG